MEIKFFCPYWGSKHLDIRTFFDKAKKAGYDGVEMGLPLDNDEKDKITGLLKEFNLLFIAQHFETCDHDFHEHKEAYRKRLENLAKAKPLFINSHTGKDYFPFAQNVELLGIAEEIASAYGVNILHETHRSRFLFAAHVTRNYLKKIPALRLTVDFSHWCNVAESYLQNQQDAVDLAISRAGHIHARVGFPEGPQVPDPRVPEWEEALSVHVSWWKEIARQKQSVGQQILTVTPEFGPYPYMPILPFTRQPVTDQWDINVYMMNYLKQVLTD